MWQEKVDVVTKILIVSRISDGELLNKALADVERTVLTVRCSYTVKKDFLVK